MTITVDEETARWARLEAARRETSVSRLVGELLGEYMRQQEGYVKAMEQYLARPARPLKPRRKRYPQRDALHERAPLR